MKFITFIIFFSTLASASETKTECPWIKQMERRANPKVHLQNVSSKMRVNSTKSANTSIQ